MIPVSNKRNFIPIATFFAAATPGVLVGIFSSNRGQEEIRRHLDEAQQSLSLPDDAKRESDGLRKSETELGDGAAKWDDATRFSKRRNVEMEKSIEEMKKLTEVVKGLNRQIGGSSDGVKECIANSLRDKARIGYSGREEEEGKTVMLKFPSSVFIEG